MNHSKFHKSWDNMLGKLKEGLVPWTTLVEVLCEGNPVQQCYECGVQVHVQNVSVLHGISGLFKAIPVLLFGGGFSFSLCSPFSCSNSLRRDSLCVARTRLRKFYEKLFVRSILEEE